MRQCACSRAAKSHVDRFESVDEICNFATRVWSAGGRTEMRATAKRAVAVDQTIAALLIEHRTNTIRIFGQRFPSRGAECLRRHERFTFREVRRAASQLEV